MFLQRAQLLSVVCERCFGALVQCVAFMCSFRELFCCFFLCVVSFCLLFPCVVFVHCVCALFPGVAAMHYYCAMVLCAAVVCIFRVVFPCMCFVRGQPAHYSSLFHMPTQSCTSHSAIGSAPPAHHHSGSVICLREKLEEARPRQRRVSMVSGCAGAARRRQVRALVWDCRRLVSGAQPPGEEAQPDQSQAEVIRLREGADFAGTTRAIKRRGQPASWCLYPHRRRGFHAPPRRPRTPRRRVCI